MRKILNFSVWGEPMGRVSEHDADGWIFQYTEIANDQKKQFPDAE
jgi:hypothetical protein